MQGGGAGHQTIGRRPAAAAGFVRQVSTHRRAIAHTSGSLGLPIRLRADLCACRRLPTFRASFFEIGVPV